MADQHLASSTDSRSKEAKKRLGSLVWTEWEWPGFREGSSQLYQLASDIPEQEHYDRRDQELERLCKQVKELEVQGRHVTPQTHTKDLDARLFL